VHPQVRWVLVRQVFVAVVAGVVAGAAQGLHAAVSAFIGGGIGVLGGGAYAWRALHASGGGECVRRDPKKAFRAQVAGEGYKLAVTFLLFALVFKSYGQLAALPLFLAYAATIAVYWIALLAQR